ncbi:MAG: elongation factor G [Rhizobiaceae bacterium]
MGNRAGERRSGPKCVAIVGPFASGKTTLLEALLARTGAISKQNTVASGNTVGDHSQEARDHQMSVEASVATTEFMGESITFVDCPGSVEFAVESEAILAACDLAVVVAEADEKKIPALQLIMRKLEDAGVPRMLFLNKVDKSELGVRDTLQLLQPASRNPLLLRQIALRKDGIVIGSIDLALERAYVWREHAESEITPIPDDEKAREVEARFSMLETLADHDDALMEQLLDEIEPPQDAVFDDLSADLREGTVTPVFIGTAEAGNGVLRLLKAIRHDGPDISDTVERLAAGEPLPEPCLQVMKTVHTPHGGKLSIARVLNGKISDGQELTTSDDRSGKVSGLYQMLGKDQTKIADAPVGETVALGKLEEIQTGDTVAPPKSNVTQLAAMAAPHTVFSTALKPKERKDEVKLSSALHRLGEEDPSLTLEHNQESGETILSGHGEMHLRVIRERLENKYQIPVESSPAEIPYRETIVKGTTQRGRHKKQSGGHGQFGDVVLEIKPMPRGSGFEFTDTITGGVVPKQYIPSVEHGIRDFLKCGPLGFPVVDLAVNLSDGSYHSVDSSDMAFQMAGKLAMREGLTACHPVLLEPIMKVEISTPNDTTAKITAIIPQRRGQILGFDAKPGWDGWDVVEATMPLAEMRDLIIELRSATAGVASYSAEFDHMAELVGRLADDVMSQHGKQAAA